MTTTPPITDLEARARWHLGIGYSTDHEQYLFDLDDGEFHEPATCWNCGGSGSLVACMDDLCRGSGTCMHGDNRMCTTCKGEGSL